MEWMDGIDGVLFQTLTDSSEQAEPVRKTPNEMRCRFVHSDSDSLILIRLSLCSLWAHSDSDSISFSRLEIR